MLRPSKNRGPGEALIWDLLTFDKLLTGPVVHLIYWAGLGIIALGAFSALGASVGVALREDSMMGKLLALPVLVAGLLFCAIGVLLWRSFCEFYVAVFRISEDLSAMRESIDAEQNRTPR